MLPNILLFMPYDPNQVWRTFTTLIIVTIAVIAVVFPVLRTKELRQLWESQRKLSIVIIAGWAICLLICLWYTIEYIYTFPDVEFMRANCDEDFLYSIGMPDNSAPLICLIDLFLGISIVVSAFATRTCTRQTKIYAALVNIFLLSQISLWIQDVTFFVIPDSPLVSFGGKNVGFTIFIFGCFCMFLSFLIANMNQLPSANGSKKQLTINIILYIIFGIIILLSIPLLLFIVFATL